MRFKEPKSASDFEDIIMKEKGNIPKDDTAPPNITAVSYTHLTQPTICSE